MFNSDSFALGWLTCKFECNKALSLSEAESLVRLSKELTTSIDAELMVYLENTYPNVLR